MQLRTPIKGHFTSPSVSFQTLGTEDRGGTVAPIPKLPLSLKQLTTLGPKIARKAVSTFRFHVSRAVPFLTPCSSRQRGSAASSCTRGPEGERRGRDRKDGSSPEKQGERTGVSSRSATPSDATLRHAAPRHAAPRPALLEAVTGEDRERPKVCSKCSN